MNTLETLKHRYINKEIDKETFYFEVAYYLANRIGEEYEQAVKEVTQLINELKLTAIQSNKIWKRAQAMYKRSRM